MDRDMEEYSSNLEKAMIVYFRASRLHPQDGSVFIRLGRLSEIRALWTDDPSDRESRLEDAQVFFARSARLEFEKNYDPDALRRFEETLPSGPVNDPYLSSLAWSGRLRRGEVSLDELKERHGGGRVNAFNNPLFWEERLFLLSNHYGDERKEMVREAAAEFESHLEGMPAVVYLPGRGNRYAGENFTKAGVLYAWAGTLLELSATEADPRFQAELFLKALGLYESALKLPLSRAELSILHSRLEKADYAVSGKELSLALWNFKDRFFQSWRKKSPDDPEVLFRHAAAYFRRALLENDPSLFAARLGEAERKSALYLAESPDRAAAAARLGDYLLRETNSLARYLNLPPEDAAERKRELYRLSASLFREALDLNPDSLPLRNSLSGALLSAALLAVSPEEFESLFGEALRLQGAAAARDPFPGPSFLSWGEILLAAEPPQNIPQAADRLALEALSSFQRCLAGGTADAEDLSRMANLVSPLAGSRNPEREQAVNLLIRLSEGLTTLKPREPAYRFAYALALALRLSWERDMSEGAALFNSPNSRAAFLSLLDSLAEGLELLSFGNPPDFSAAFTKTADLFYQEKALRRPGGPDLMILETDDFIRVSRPGTSYRERLTGTLNHYLVRVFNALPPEGLPPWHKLRLASFLRLAASSGYLPPEEEAAYFRLAHRLLSQALYDQPSSPEDLRLEALLLSEQALVLAESTLGPAKDPEKKDEAALALARAELVWEEAEKTLPGSSRWARARWAAWREDEAALKDLVVHDASQEDRLYWPPFSSAYLEPAFRRYRDLPWFKRAWFGYGR
jgi:hypothetical protein